MQAGSTEGSLEQSDYDYLDLGSARIPNLSGLAVDVDLDPKTGHGKSFTLHYKSSIASVQIFAAAANSDAWPEVRDAIVAGLREQKVECDVELGKFGTEVHSVMPTVDLDGNAYVHPVRFLGRSGPRWLLRVVVSGGGAVIGEEFNEIDNLISQIVVHRGEEPMAPGERLTIFVPGQPAQETNENSTSAHIHIEL